DHRGAAPAAAGLCVPAVRIQREDAALAVSGLLALEHREAGAGGIMPHEPRIIVALDYGTAAAAEAVVARVSPARCRLKVGLELYTAAGPAFVGGLVERGFSVFLDLKFHDIPNTVERACRQAAKLGVDLLTVHCLGGRRMLEAACAGVRGG